MNSLERFRNYCGLIKVARTGFPWEKTTKGDVASVYTNCETAPVVDPPGAAGTRQSEPSANPCDVFVPLSLLSWRRCRSSSCAPAHCEHRLHRTIVPVCWH